jgi:putative ABC transport system permease protein
MLKNYLKVALRNLTRNKLYSAINVFGLAIGIAGCILIMLFVQHEASFDNFHPNVNRIFRVVEIEKKPDGEKSASAFQPMPLAPTLLAEIPEIKSAVRFFAGSSIVAYGEKAFGEELRFSDPAFFTVFNFPLLQGNFAAALTLPNAVVISEKMAQKYFGDENPLGKLLTISIQDKTEDFVVTAVAKNAPENSSIQFNFVLPIQKFRQYELKMQRWNNFNGTVFVQLADQAASADLENKLGPFVQKYFGKMIERSRNEGYMSKDAEAFQLRLQPLREMYLGSTNIAADENKSNPLYSYILSGIAGFVLLIACINFMTLAIGRSSGRAREVGMRKVLGAVRVQLMKQFWGEALLLSLLAFALGIGLAELFLPTFNQFASKNLTLNNFFQGWFFFGLIGLWLFVGLMAGSYPSFFLSRFEPVSVLKGATKLGGKNFFTQSLVVFQFSLAIFLIVASLVMAAQLKFLATKNLGYNAEQVVIIPMRTGSNNNGEELVARFRSQLMGQAGIVNISGISGAFTHGYDINGFEHNGKNRSAFVYRVDPNFLATLDIPLVDGRNFLQESGTDAKQAIIVNEALAQEFEWQPPFIGKRLAGWDEKNIPGGPEVIGVVKNFHFRSLREKIAPALFFMNPEWYVNEMLVRISPANIPQTLALLEKTWKEIAPNRPFDYTFLDDEVQQQYQLEQRWGNIVRYSTVFAIMLACLGLFGLSTLAAINRTKEIGIRKVLGASIANVTGLVSKEFVKLVLIANVIAWPAAYFVLNKLLQNYAYRIFLGPKFFVLATALALMIAFFTVSIQALKAALANPVQSLRYE